MSNNYITTKEKFIEIFTANIKRDGADKLLKFLEDSDFFNAPCSTRFHLCVEGGLVKHSLNVYNRLKTLATTESDETVAICGLLHDLCKVNFYVVDYRNAKNKQGVWEKVPYYTVEDKLCYGHGEGSVFLISKFISLTMEEAIAIRYHMGGFDESIRGGNYSFGNAASMYPLCPKLICADLLSTYIDEVEK